eukprot:2321527-Rhodomonas_salina.1
MAYITHRKRSRSYNPRQERSSGTCVGSTADGVARGGDDSGVGGTSSSKKLQRPRIGWTKRLAKGRNSNPIAWYSENEIIVAPGTMSARFSVLFSDSRYTQTQSPPRRVKTTLDSFCLQLRRYTRDTRATHRHCYTR